MFRTEPGSRNSGKNVDTTLIDVDYSRILLIASPDTMIMRTNTATTRLIFRISFQSISMK